MKGFKPYVAKFTKHIKTKLTLGEWLEQLKETDNDCQCSLCSPWPGHKEKSILECERCGILISKDDLFEIDLDDVNNLNCREKPKETPGLKLVCYDCNCELYSADQRNRQAGRYPTRC